MLRDYQKEAMAQIRSEFLKGNKKVLVWLATGSGKTVLFCEMVKNNVQKGNNSLIVVRGRALVDQASHRLSRESVQHGVLMANAWNYRPTLPVQVASIDTLIARKLKPKADLIIVDEAHMAQSGGYKEFLAQYPDSYVVAVTATPYTEKGLRHVADSIVHPITMQELIDQGYLSPFRYFAPSEPDLRGVKISSSTKDYVSDQLEERMVAGQLTGQIVEHWVKIAQGKPTLCFAVNVHHSKILMEKFRSAGISAEHCDADTPDAERKRIIKRHERGETKVICNVGIFCTGVDLPYLGALIMARPTKSLNLFIQMAGRLTRPFPGKTHGLLLDHAGNINRHGFPTMEPEVDLDGKITGEKSEQEHKTCKVCFCIFKGSSCPECGTAPVVPPSKEIEESNEELIEIQVTAKDPIGQWLELLEIQRKKTGRKNGWQYYKLLEKFSAEECKPYLPQWFTSRQSDDPFSCSPFKGVSK